MHSATQTGSLREAYFHSRLKQLVRNSGHYHAGMYAESTADIVELLAGSRSDADIGDFQAEQTRHRCTQHRHLRVDLRAQALQHDRHMREAPSTQTFERNG